MPLYENDQIAHAPTIADINDIHINNDYIRYPTEAYISIEPAFVTNEDLNKFTKKIYEIITEHTKIDISEEEFMNIIRSE